ncbi:MAG: hypothetical protein OHK0022_33720 [Roseiflexaceae bacterium]
MRRPDDFVAPVQLGTDGSHLAATLDYLARLNEQNNGHNKDYTGSQVYAQAANRLAELINDVRDLWIDRDERRELLTLFVTGRDKTSYPARALSDGTLRFLALTVLALDPRQRGVICLEEPENGIHPERIPPMLRLLQDIAVDTDIPIGEDNPLRQVIINTHSPSVVQQVPEDSLVVARPRTLQLNSQLVQAVSFAGLPDTWRSGKDASTISLGELLSYLNPVAPPQKIQMESTSKKSKTRRVIDRPDMQLVLPFEDKYE